MNLLESLQNSSLSMWLLGSNSIWAYPTVLTLHTVGLAILVGASVLLDLRLLGFGKQIPITRMRKLFFFVWVGFIINLASGLVLFAAEAVDRSRQPVFFLKLGLIICALVVGGMRTGPFKNASATIKSQTRMFAASSLFF